MAENEGSVQKDMLQGPYDFRINKIHIYPYIGAKPTELRFVMAEMNIYEDMFAPCICGNLVIVDSTNLIMNLPIVGHEFIEVDFDVPTFNHPFVHRFRVTSVSKRSTIEEKKQAYVINFISEEMFMHEKTSVSKSWRDTAPEIIVSDICKQYLLTDAKLDLEPCKYKENVVFPSWNPFNCINYLSQIAISTANGSVNYMFFENQDGYHFTSLDRLFNEADGSKAAFYPIPMNFWRRTSTIEYVYQPANYRGSENKEGGDKEVPDIASDFYAIESFDFSYGFDVLANLEGGMYGNHVVTCDIAEKTIAHHYFNYDTTWDKHIHMEPNRVPGIGQEKTYILSSAADDLTDAFEQKQMVVPKHKGMWDVKMDSNHFEESDGTRASRIAQLLNWTMLIVVPGDTFRKVGEMVNVSLISPEPVNYNRTAIEDKFASGRYMISRLRHQITSGVDGRYRLHMELIKDSLKEPLPISGNNQQMSMGQTFINTGASTAIPGSITDRKIRVKR